MIVFFSSLEAALFGVKGRGGFLVPEVAGQFKETD